MKKTSICFFLIAALLSSLLTCAFAEAGGSAVLSAEEQQALDYLGKELAEPAEVHS